MTPRRQLLAREPGAPGTAAPGNAAADPDLPAVLAAQRDRRAFGVLYRRYLEPIYAYAFYQLGDHHDAEDVTERVFLSALKALGGYRDRGSTFRAWLFRIAHNAVLNARRSEKRRRTEPLPADLEEPSAASSDPAGVAARTDEMRRVRAAVDELSPDRRQVIVLRFVDGLSTTEIAEVLQRSEGAVRVLQHRALREIANRV